MVINMKRDFINYCGLLGIVAFLSYTAAVVFSPLAYSGYNWMAQAVSDLSAANAPSLSLWNQLTLRAIHKTMDKRKVYGIDKVTKGDYEQNLEENLANLVKRMKSGSYRPNPIRRVYIPKETKRNKR